MTNSLRPSPIKSVVIAQKLAISGISDEMRVEIKGEVYWLWQAVDEDGQVLDINHAETSGYQSG